MKKRTTRTNKHTARTKRTTPGRTSLPKVIRNLLPAPVGSTVLADLAAPSEAAMERYCNIPLLFEKSPDARSVRGGIVYDSWAEGPTIALRDTADGHIRRLKLKAGHLVLEVVAERRDNTWEFVARVYDSKKVTHSFVLRVGDRKFLPQTGGFFVWSSKIVPKVLRLESFETSVDFGKLSWQ